MKELKNVFIIDDDSDDQEIFMICVENVCPDIACRTANSGVEALSIVESEKNYIPNFIFVDVNMPKMNGIECLQRLRKIERLNLTKIFMYSTTSERSLIERSRNLGANDFIVKPTKTAVLKEKLSQILNNV